MIEGNVMYSSVFIYFFYVESYHFLNKSAFSRKKSLLSEIESPRK